MPRLARAVLSELAEVVGARHVVTDPDRLAGPCVDWTGRFRGSTPALVRPGDTDEVAGVVAVCRRAGMPMTLQGGNTGLVGGSVPLGGELLVSLARLRRLEVAPGVGQVTAGAGVAVGQLQSAARAAGWSYGVDLSSRDSATVGGTVATNAGGLHMVRYGDTRAQLVGVEAVLGDASVVSHLGGLVKDNTGYHLPGLLCGSEGTLGVVTAARLRLVPPAGERAVALLAFASVQSAMVAAGELRRRLRALEAIELFLREGLELVCRHRGLPEPFPRPATAFLLVEVAASTDPTEGLAAAVDDLSDVAASAVAVEPERRAALWAYREAHTEAVNSLGPPHKLDVTLPEEKLAAFVSSVPALVASARPSAEVFQWGHAGDGNVHVNVVKVAPDDEAVDEIVLRAVVEAGGSISAEHGIGTAKRRWMAWARSAAELSAFRAVKRALDPDGILNPAVLLPEPP